MPRKRKDDKWTLEPQKTSAAQILTYIASTGATSEKFGRATAIVLRMVDEHVPPKLMC